MRCDNKSVFFTNPGIGDAMILSAAAHNYYQQYGSTMRVHTSYPELFYNNPHVNVVSKAKSYYDFPQGDDFCYLGYNQQREDGHGGFFLYLPDQSLVLAACRSFLKPGEILLSPEIFLSDAEKCYGRFSKKEQIVVNYCGKEIYKTWSYKKASQLVHLLTEEGYQVIQTGMQSDKLLPGAFDLRGKLSLRQLASVFFASRLFVGPIGGPMHIARAVGCPGVILCAGAESHLCFDYQYEFVENPSGCRRCRTLRVDPFFACLSDGSCTRSITLEAVWNAVRKELSLPKHKLEPVKRLITQEEINKICSIYPPKYDSAKVHFFYIGLTLSSGKVSRRHFYAGLQQNAQFKFSTSLTKESLTLCFDSGFQYRFFSLYALGEEGEILNKLPETLIYESMISGARFNFDGNDFFSSDVLSPLRFQISGDMLPAGTFGVAVECFASSVVSKMASDGFCTWATTHSTKSLICYTIGTVFILFKRMINKIFRA